MTIVEATTKYGLPQHSTPVDLECRYSKVLTFGDKILVAGRFNTGKGKLTNLYFGAAYDFLFSDHTCDGEILLRAVSEVEFEDDGHAIAWAMKQ